MDCGACHKEIPEDSEFCPFCGESVGSSLACTCSTCGEPMGDEDLFCGLCGASQVSTEDVPEPKEFFQPKDPQPKSTVQTFRRLAPLILVTGVCLVLAGVLPEFFEGKSERLVDPTPTASKSESERKPSPPKPKPKAEPISDPLVDITEYYHLISTDQFKAAYERRSVRSKRSTSYQAFSKTWSNNQGIEINKLKTISQSGNQASVDARIFFTDRNRAGKVLTRPYVGTIKAVKEGGIWRYDGADFKLDISPYFIDPGIGVGAIQIGSPLPADVTQTYGRLTSVSPAGNSMDSGSYYWEGLMNVKTHDGRSAKNVFSIFITGQEFRTPEGIGPGSTVDQMLKAYPNARKELNMDDNWEYHIPGASFGTYQGKVYEVFVAGM
jgi:RNA polymerase subunit RPABC4/transcription elongation factor Spt4